MNIFIQISVLYCIFFHVSSVIASRSIIVSLDERWICNIKKSCQDCLQLPHCSWCPTENICFAEHLSHNENFCVERIRHPTHGLSLEENAACACAGPEVENSCPPGDSEQKCSGRGKCVCGRCFCDANPDPIHPSKVITGEHCEYDNFSCDGPKCNEGPYYIYQESDTNTGEEAEKL